MRIDFSLVNRAPLDPGDLLGCANAPSGTDVNALGLAEELQRRGHAVRVFGNFTVPLLIPDLPYSRSIQYVHQWDITAEGRYLRSRPHQEEADVVIAYHDGRMLPEWNARLKVCMHQTYGLPDMQHGTASEGADVYLSATRLCANYLREKWGGEWDILPNAWDYGAHQPWRPVPGRIIYHTDATRGLHLLLEALPQIRQEVPSAHLHVYGLNPDTLRGRQPNGDFTSRCQRVLKGLEVNADAVTLLPRVSRNAILQAISEASCFAYPVDPPVPCEVFPMSVVDCLATGCPVVMVPGDGLENVFRFQPGFSAVTLSRPEFFARFVAYVLKGSQGQHFYGGSVGRQWIEPFTFAAMADRFEDLIKARLP